MESAVIAQPATTEDDLLASLIRKCNESEEATRQAREKAERDRDYLDGKQLTQEEYDALVKRGQPPVAFNIIRSRVEFQKGLEKKQRRDPKAWPRNNPNDAQAADAFTDGMRYAVEEADYMSHRSSAWSNIIVEGMGGVEAWVEPARDGNYSIKLGQIPWDRLITDPHSAKPDFSDANYQGMYLWLDVEDAIARYEGHGDPAAIRNIVEYTLSPNGMAETYDDKPRWQLWADRARKRVRVAILWCKHARGWHYYEFTRGGMLMSGPSPYVDEDGIGYCPLILESCYIDRENNRYGTVRDLIDPQDEVNKRRSKSLDLLTRRGVVADMGAVENVAQAKKELARPDFFIEKVPNSDFQIIPHSDLAVGQANLLQQAMAYISQSGPNAALLGKGVEDQSGKAIEAQQQGGLIEQGDLLDTLRRLDRRVFRMVALLMKQFWTAEKWVRVTDDELAPKWVGLNVPQVEMDPWTGQPVVTGVENNVAELDVDILVTDAPDTVTLDGDNYQTLMQLLSTGLPPPIMRLAIELHPSLPARRKKLLLDMLEQMAQPQQADPRAEEAIALEMEEKAAGIEKTRADAEKSKASAFATVANVMAPPQPPQQAA